MKYESYHGSMTIGEAIEQLGKQHVEFLINYKDWHSELKRRIHGLWLANGFGKTHTAYCTLMQAGKVLTRNAL